MHRAQRVVLAMRCPSVKNGSSNLQRVGAESSGDDAMQRTAQCQCGSLRATASGEPRINNVCHCRACQRRTGSVIHAGAYFLQADVQCEGPNVIYSRSAESGRGVHFHFCPNCGTSLYWEADTAPDFLGIAVGCFADQDFPAPSFSVWEEGLHPWLGLAANIARFQQGVGEATRAALVAPPPSRTETS